MTLDRYIEKLHANVDSFEKNWRENNKAKYGTVQWPLEFGSEVDWDEQFIIWLGKQPGEE